MNPMLICWLTAALLTILTPMALLFGVDMWRVIAALISEMAMLAVIGWLRQ